jgi:hypothetical protein
VISVLHGFGQTNTAGVTVANGAQTSQAERTVAAMIALQRGLIEQSVPNLLGAPETDREIRKL